MSDFSDQAGNEGIDRPFKLNIRSPLTEAELFFFAEDLLAKNIKLGTEVQRQLELRRLEWNRAEGLQSQVKELLKEIEQLKREAQA